MQEIMEVVDIIIDKYSEDLKANGIRITASKHYFEARVRQRFVIGENYKVYKSIIREIDRKNEEKKGYNHVRNRYHSIVLSVHPIEKGIVRREYCKEYAFPLKKVERAYIGTKPKKTTYGEQKLLSKIEKRILKILSKAQKTNAKKACKDTVYDALRYIAPRYGYKRKFLNIDRAYWELILLVSGGILVLIIAFIIRLTCKLI